MLSPRNISAGTITPATRDLVVFNITKLTDQEFIDALNEDISTADFMRASLACVPIREENIRLMRETRRLNTTSKELNTILKSNNQNKIIQYLCSLDDYTLTVVAKDSSVKKIINSNTALEHRYSLLKSSDEYSPRDHEKNYTDIQLTGNYQTDMEILLRTPRDYIEEVLDPNKYVQDEVVDEIRAIVTSPEFKKYKSITN
jgi:hypothetical protein